MSPARPDAGGCSKIHLNRMRTPISETAPGSESSRRWSSSRKTRSMQSGGVLHSEQVGTKQTQAHMFKTAPVPSLLSPISVRYAQGAAANVSAHALGPLAQMANLLGRTPQAALDEPSLSSMPEPGDLVV